MPGMSTLGPISAWSSLLHYPYPTNANGKNPSFATNFERTKRGSHSRGDGDAAVAVAGLTNGARAAAGLTTGGGRVFLRSPSGGARKLDIGNAAKQEQDWKKCEGMKQDTLTKNRKVMYLFRSLSKLGCDVDPWKFVSCAPCEDPISGAMSANEDGEVEIFMCQNTIRDQENFEVTLTHELIHAFDTCRAHVDFTDCDHHACTEIRAANLSGDCDYGAELSRGHIPSFTGNHQKCVSRRATLSVSANPKCPNKMPVDAVDRMLAPCLADKAPFYAIP